MRHTVGRVREDARIHFDLPTMQFRVVCEPHSLSYPADTTFDARLLLDLHNAEHADSASDLFLPPVEDAESPEQRHGRLLQRLRLALGLTVERAAVLGDVAAAQVVAAEEGRLEDGPIQLTLSATYATVAAGLSNARRA
jgi:hypothetical protein